MNKLIDCSFNWCHCEERNDEAIYSERLLRPFGTRNDMLAKVFIVVTLFISFLPINLKAEEITVAAAASLQFTLDELKGGFEKDNPTIQLITIFGSSGKLTAQIENGAPFDIFLSADMEYPQALYKKGFTVNEPKIYSYGKLVLWTMRDLDLTQGMSILLDSKVKKIALPTPQTAPYGRQAVNALKYFNLYSNVSSKLVYGESIAQVNQFIATQAADIGMTAKSVVLSPHMKEQGRWVDVDPSAYQPIAQGAVILKFAEDKKLPARQKFFDFLFSDKARIVFEKYGYQWP